MKKNITDLITRDGLFKAAKRMRKNRKPGLDGETRDQFLKRILETDLADNILTQLETGSYRPSPLLLRLIPKANGKLREIYIPTVQDAVVQSALVAGLTPTVESRFLNSSYGFRPKRNVSGAVKEASRIIREGYTICYSIDLETFFPNMKRVLMRKYLRDYDLDDNIRTLINSFITAKIKGQKVRTHQGIPAGIPLAPTLANMYLHSLDRELHRQRIPFIRYADDITLFFKSKEDYLLHEKFWGVYEQRFGIVVNRKKTKLYSEDVRLVLGFCLDIYGGITVTSAVIDKIEESLNSLLVDYNFCLLQKINRIEQRIIFSLKYYREVENFCDFKNELNLMRIRLFKRLSEQFSKIEILNALNVPIERIDEYETHDELEFLTKEIASDK